MDVHLDIAALGKHFGQQTVLKNLDLQVRRGECLVIFGKSGSGKTTLLRCIAGILSPDAGSISMDGKNAAHMHAMERGVAMAFQNFSLYPHKSAWDNIASPLRARGLSREEIRQRVQEVATMLQIDHVLAHLPRQLSNGQKQRTSLARALVHRPRLLLLDDPLRNVDAKMRFAMRQELPELFHKLGTTVLYVSQDWREALALADRIGVLQDGRFAQIDTPQAVYRNPRNCDIARLFGDPPINLWPLTPQAAPGGVQVSLGGQALRLDGLPQNLAGRACILGVRPQDVLWRPGPCPEGAADALAVELEAAMPLNLRTAALLRTTGPGTPEHIWASLPTAQHALQTPMSGHIRLAPGSVRFFDEASKCLITAK